jgi:hypothetical protein
MCGERVVSHAYIIGHVTGVGNGAMKGDTHRWLLSYVEHAVSMTLLSATLTLHFHSY